MMKNCLGHEDAIAPFIFDSIRKLTNIIGGNPKARLQVYCVLPRSAQAKLSSNMFESNMRRRFASEGGIEPPSDTSLSIPTV
jgi:hypothetical protein